MNLGTCRDCAHPVLWAGTSAGGRLPLDPAPHPRGTHALDQYGDIGPAHADGVPDTTRAYLPHRLTCPEKERC